MLDDENKNFDITIDRDIKMMLPKKNIDKLFVNKKI